jgi:hypothetical protein
MQKQVIQIQIEVGKDWQKSFRIATLINGDYEKVAITCNLKKDGDESTTNNFVLTFELKHIERVGAILGALVDLKIIGHDDGIIETEED